MAFDATNGRGEKPMMSVPLYVLAVKPADDPVWVCIVVTMIPTLLQDCVSRCIEVETLHRAQGHEPLAHEWIVGSFHTGQCDHIRIAKVEFMP